MAVAIGAVVLASLDSVVQLGVRAHTWGRSTNELTYQGQTALERIAATARSTAPQPISTPPANTSGSWFAPVMYCVNGARQLIETVVTDGACTGTTVIAAFVTAFSVQQPADAGPVDSPVAMLSLTLSDDGSGRTVTLAAGVRVGGGTL